MLTLIPTPIDEKHDLESTAKSILIKAQNNQDSIFCVEEAKIARRRWIRWGLDRNIIDKFVLFNEHTRDELTPDLIKSLKKGKNIFLMSDCGLPAFCDPGKNLVDHCHKNNIKVTSTPFYNSTILALALSGFNHDKFNFEGFLSKENNQRKKDIIRISKNKKTTIIMDTPYRLNKIIDEVKEVMPEREVFIAMDLNKDDELLIRAKAKNLQLEKSKREFILILGALNE
jgi:16S rRNA (cytidine1402-2'-O)-methyltransferase